MKKRRAHTGSSVSLGVQTLEGRIALSGIGPALDSAGALRHRAVEVAARSAGGEGTKTVLAVDAGTLGQPITFNVTVRASAAAGSPTGTVNLIEDRVVVQTLTLSPELSTSGRFAFSSASYTLEAEPGGSAYYFGKYPVTAEYIPSGAFMKSTGRTTFAVRPPAFAPLDGGVKIAIVTPGSGPGIEDGQTASVLYTGFLAKTGHIFDDSVNDGGTPITFQIGGGQVIPGFNEGIVGMEVGETEMIRIPPAEGYGRTANGPIPGNSTLVFLVTLTGIS
jgi:FKBP-type peptidyl-prolyl cis-trans isomerase/Bacterial Ig-like domain (group 3)